MGKPKKVSFMTELNASPAFHIQPKNHTQNYLLECIQHNVMTVVIGPAGTGKTFCTGMKAAQLYLKGGYKKVILTRPNIATGRTLGHFPGTLEEKMGPWLKPITSVLEEGLGKGKFEYMMNKGQIEIQPMETIRGNSFEDSIVIVDEVQNLSIEEIKAVTTRIGENSKLILMGDPNQSDLKHGTDLTRFVEMCDRNGIECPIVRFSVDEIVRSDIVMQLVKMFHRENL
ncbi:MAG: PhoH family protein [Candidatus Thiodiazotropha taylori]|uniref:PhoH family protein n=1 Tax=Candidatus Thiodiazotropha taylori TaxID=2792791 RepID=A0A9E4KA95_9GAMM|nr:PhoH family protein [Candidatus Thiodiazotropha taylori]MCW4255065.1 PhoH family protein [Candidatus Thiodiazotropha taylori]